MFDENEKKIVFSTFRLHTSEGLKNLTLFPLQPSYIWIYQISSKYVDIWLEILYGYKAPTLWKSIGGIRAKFRCGHLIFQGGGGGGWVFWPWKVRKNILALKIEYFWLSRGEKNLDPPEKKKVLALPEEKRKFQTWSKKVSHQNIEWSASCLCASLSVVLW